MEALTHPSPRAEPVKQIAGWSSKIAALRASRPSLALYAEMRLCKLARTRKGETVVVPVKDQRFSQDRESAYPARFVKVDLHGKEALDSFFGLGLAWESYRDEHIYEAAREFAADPSVYLTGHDLIQLSRSITLGLLARRGVRVGKADLPF